MLSKYHYFAYSLFLLYLSNSPQSTALRKLIHFPKSTPLSYSQKTRFTNSHSNVLSRWCNGKESTCNAADTRDEGLIPGSGISPAGGNGNPVQYSCLKIPMDRGAW